MQLLGRAAAVAAQAPVPDVPAEGRQLAAGEGPTLLPVEAPAAACAGPQVPAQHPAAGPAAFVDPAACEGPQAVPAAAEAAAGRLAALGQACPGALGSHHSGEGTEVLLRLQHCSRAADKA